MRKEWMEDEQYISTPAGDPISFMRSFLIHASGLHPLELLAIIIIDAGFSGP